METIQEMVIWAVTFAAALQLRGAISKTIEAVVPEEKLKNKLLGEWVLTFVFLFIAWLIFRFWRFH